LIVVQSTLVSRWFAHDPQMSLSLSLAITISFSRGSAFLSMSVLPFVVDYGLHFCLWMLAAVSAISVIFTVLMVIMDRRYEKYLLVPQAGAPVSVKDITKFPKEFWIMAIMTFTFYASVLTIFTIGVEFLQSKWGYSLWTASLILSSIYLTPTIFEPFVGYLVDHIGKRCKMMVLSCLLVIPAFFVLLYSDVHPLVGCILLGISYTVLPACLWPGAALMIPPNILGTAYGVLASSLNAGAFVAPLVITSLQEKTGSYTFPIYFLIGLAAISSILSSLVWFFDFKNGKVLENTSVVKTRDEKKKE